MVRRMNWSNMSEGAVQHRLAADDSWRSGVVRLPSRHDFKNPANVADISGGDSLLPDLINTPAFQRLRYISFLGGIDYCLVPKPNGSPAATRHTRYQHSLGVLYMAHLYCSYRNLGSSDRRLVCAAALLHDIGHPPLSHSLESIFKERFDIEHHTATQDIICGRVPLGKAIVRTLRHHGLNVDRVAAVVSGSDADFRQFFGGPINFDTIEGVLRSYMYAGRRSTSRRPADVTLAAIRRTSDADRNAVDAFWRCKNEVYEWIINSRKGVLSDCVCRSFMLRHIESIRPEEDFFGTEDGIFRKLPGLRALLECRSFEQEVMEHIDAPILYQARRYYVDHEGDFFGQQDGCRYRQTRQVRTLPTNFMMTKPIGGEQGVLFRDEL